MVNKKIQDVNTEKLLRRKKFFSLILDTKLGPERIQGRYQPRGDLLFFLRALRERPDPDGKYEIN